MTYTYAATVNPGDANPFNDPCLLFMGIITMSFIGIVIGLTIGTGGNFVWKPL